MMILVMTIPVTVTLVILFIILFGLSVKGGQFEDLETPKHTPLSDDETETDLNIHQKAKQEKT